MKRAVVIGYGNPLRGDDGIGWRVAELVRERVPDDLVEVIQCYQLTPELAASIEGAKLVIFLDAGVDLAAGQVCEAVVEPTTTDAWSHRLAPGELLALAERVYGHAPPAMLIKGGIASASSCDELSELAAGCVVTMADLAGKTLRLADLTTHTR